MLAGALESVPIICAGETRSRGRTGAKGRRVQAGHVSRGTPTVAQSCAPPRAAPAGVGRGQARFSAADRVFSYGRGHACAASGAGGRTSRLAIWRSISACMAACSSRAFDIMSAIASVPSTRHLVTSRVPCRRVHAPSRTPQRRGSHAPARAYPTSRFWLILLFDIFPLLSITLTLAHPLLSPTAVLRR